VGTPTPTGEAPLVSVGIPTYNRPDGLRQAMGDICAQTFQNLEIIVSDNASPDPQNILVAEQFAAGDRRIRVFAQPSNIGPLSNFEFVLRHATGKYFMWAADDDRWQDWFVERCVVALEVADGSAPAAITEAQYFTEHGLCDYFPEGRAFRLSRGLSRLHRLKLMLDENYGNLFYSVYRREVLLRDGVTLFSALGFTSLNEIPMFLQVATAGEWLVLPEVGMFKRTRMATYQQARWEMMGGRLPKGCRATSIASLRALYGYHVSALKEIRRSIRVLDIPDDEKRTLEKRASRNIWRHLMFVAIGYKPAR